LRLINIKLLERSTQTTQLGKNLAQTVAVTAFLIFALLNPNTGFASDTSPEYAVKAAYIFNILRFTEVADNSVFADANEIKICLLGDNKFGSYITPIESKNINGKPLSITTKTSLQQSLDCHLIFVGNSSEYSANKIAKSLGDKKIIVVGNDLDFVRNGGMFAFYIENKKVRLGLNRNTLERSKLKISSLLLEVCTTFRDSQ
jgi:hypothetical protein